MVFPKPYKIKKRSSRVPRFRKNRQKTAGDDIPLTGWVHGMEASDIEERLARAFQYRNIEFAFQIPINIQGSADDKELDFIADRFFPIDVFGKIGHEGAAQQGKDEVRATLIDEALSPQGFFPWQKIWYWQLETQEIANNTVAELFI